jgi:hypothetical protein
VFIAYFGLTEEGNKDGHVRVALDVVQNVRVDWNEDPWTEHMSIAPEAQKTFARHRLNRNGNPRGMVSQERATAQLNKHQLAPAIGQEDLDLAVRAASDLVREDQRIAHHQSILWGRRFSPCPIAFLYNIMSFMQHSHALKLVICG